MENILLSSPKYTVMDAFDGTPGMVYHVMSTPYDIFATVGSVVGGGVSLIRGKSLLPYIANGGLIGGGIGMTLGLAALAAKASQGEALQPLPWNDEGISTRIAGIHANERIRTLDATVWTGILVAGGYLAMQRKTLYSTASLGILRTLSLGAFGGGLVGITWNVLRERQKNRKFEEEWGN